ncbi:MAG: hypothetical protein KDD62_14715, partial [Bdellovibrionales bacterium]|nr:hypothetical protein [Bdellovibrionales bacterium]
MKLPEPIYQQILSSLGQWFIIRDQAGDCIFFSEGLLSALGYEGSEDLNAVFASACPDLQHQLSSSKYRFARKDGREVSYAVNERSLLDGYRLYVVLPDEASAEVRFHSQRLETLGMLAGGVAHDFNNVLAGILGHITYLKTILPQQGNHVESLNAIEEGANKASFLTQE